MIINTSYAGSILHDSSSSLCESPTFSDAGIKTRLPEKTSFKTSVVRTKQNENVRTRQKTVSLLSYYLKLAEVWGAHIRDFQLCTLSPPTAYVIDWAFSLEDWNQDGGTEIHYKDVFFVAQCSGDIGEAQKRERK